MGILATTLLLWVAFIATMKIVDDAKRKSDLTKPQLMAVYLFVIFDVMYNYTYGAVLFLEPASKDRKTLTARLIHILHSGEYEESSWRFKLAHWMCKYMIEPWDFGHCRLGRLK